MNEEKNIILAIYPNPRGFGYVCVEDAKKIVDSGVVRVRPLSNDTILVRVKKYVEYFRPTVVVVRNCTETNSSRAERIQSLIRDIETYAKGESIPVYGYSRQQIREVFELFEATTKQEISERITHWFPELAPRMPKIRIKWKDEEYTMCIFDAMALAVTHRYLTE